MHLLSSAFWLRYSLSSILLVAILAGNGYAHATPPPELVALLKGTETTAPLSGLQVATLREGRLEASYALGFAQRSADGNTPLRVDHRIRVASISKLVVAIGVMRLVEAGAVGLDDDVADVLGFPLRNPAHPKTPIRVRHLLAHTSTLRDADRYFIAAGQGQLSDFFLPGSREFSGGAHFESAYAPGHYFTYANLGFGVLGSVIERASGQRFDRYMTRAVLAPLGIQARFNPCEIPKAQRAAAFRKRGADGVWRPEGPWVAQVDAGVPNCFYGMDQLPSGVDASAALADYRLGDNGTLFSPQGGLRASAEDLRVVLKLLFDRGVVDGIRLLTQETVDNMLAAQWSYNTTLKNGNTAGEAETGGPTTGLMTSYGLSVHRIDPAAWGFENAPSLLVGHLGEAYGVLSHALIDPVTGNGIATIITGTADDPAEAAPGTSPLYRVEEDIVRWWLSHLVSNEEM